ncbi:Ubiquinol - cytochrome c reductase [Thiovulum sp. ES]|nr:Ubiquinol - cytochrome c reductase [Thiovulum sp. ES]
MANQSRRAFMGKVLGATAGVGAVASLYAMKRTWDPLPSVISAGFTTVDLSPLEAGKLSIIKWRGKPVFLLKHTPDIQTDTARDIVIGEDRYTVVIGLCTHLGCIPEWKEGEKIFHCACHGGQYDPHARQTFGPPPRPLDIPPFSLNGTSLTLGDEGEEYKKMMTMA